MQLPKSIFAGLVLFSITTLSHGANWPEWRGPLDTGVAPGGNPPTEWSETKNVKWKVEIPGRGTSTPIVWEDLVFIQTAIPTGKKVAAKSGAETPAVFGQPAPEGDRPPRRRGGGGGFGRSQAPDEVHQFVLLAIDRNTGKTRWQQVPREEVPHEGHHQDHSYASGSPVTDGKLVFAFFGSRGLHAYDLNGKLKWQKDLGKMVTKNSFGEGSSPALHDGTLVVNWDHEGDDFIVALESATGKELWRQAREEGTSWSTPLIVEHQGQAQVVVAATAKVRSYDLKTGKVIWECGGMTANAIPTPVAGDGLVYLTSGFRGSALMAIKLGRTGDLTGTDAIVWSHGKSTPYVPSPLLYEDRLYFFASNNGILSAFDAKTGKPVIDAERIESLQGVYASPVAADERIYLVGRNGASVVLKASDKLEILAENTLDDRFDASPAIAGPDLFLRGQKHLYCLSEKQ